jgi:hypothetical protein
VSARAGWIYLASMVGAAAWFAGVPLLFIIFALVTLAVSTMLLPSSSPGRRRSFRPGGATETPRRFRGDCRDIMGHEEPPVQKDAP